MTSKRAYTMAYHINRDESEVDFKEPLSPTPVRSPSRMGSVHSLASVKGPPGLAPPPQPPSPSFGLMGIIGVWVSALVFVLDLLSDVFLAYALWMQVEAEQNFYRRREEQVWFAVTLGIILVPLGVLNMLSLSWYTQNKSILGEYNAFTVKTKVEKCACVGFHLLLLGPLVRYFDMLQYGHRVKKLKHSIERGSRASVQKILPKGELAATFQLQVISRDTAMLDLFHSFLQDAPQLVFQIFLLYRNPALIAGHLHNFHLTMAAQILKILIGLFAISWSLTAYQDELRRGVAGKRQLTCGAAVICLVWRAAEAGARVLAIASFAALQINGEGGLIKVYSDSAPRGAVLSFPAMAALVLGGHWFLMIIWIHSQKTTFCHTEEGGSRPLLEFLYSVFMGWVHVFCYVNSKDTPSRGRLAFFYALVLLENTCFMVIWYMQLITKDVWMRVTVVFLDEALFAVGISCAVGYYAFLHPSRDQRPLDTQWRR